MNDSQANGQVALHLPMAMRLIAVLLVAMLAGCLSSSEAGDPPSRTQQLSVTPIEYPGSDRIVNDRIGLLAVVHNNGTAAEAIVCTSGLSVLLMFSPEQENRFAANVNGTELSCTHPFVLASGAYGTVGVEGTVTGDVMWWFGTREGRFSTPQEWNTLQVHLEAGGSGDAVGAGDHVQTITAGFWVNGTSFYTNIQALNDDPAFPAGYDRSEFGGDALPIYVYDRDRTEQPPTSKDHCRFTTINGYNEMLKRQSDGGTSVTYMAPEDGYTRPGNEDHDLYGDPLIFINTIVAHEGAVDDRPAGDPQGACFDTENTTGPLPV